MWTDEELSARISQTVNWLRERVAEARAKGLLIGISGGVDSAVVAGLCRQAFPEQCLGVIMPSRSSREDKEDALLVAEHFQIKTIEVDLGDVHTQIMEQVQQNLTSLGHQFAVETLGQGNLKARLRMSALYAVANVLNYLVVGTDNAPEYYTGYFTKYGDGGVDVLPIGSLSKAEVRVWAMKLGLPEKIANRVPSAGLWPGQTDEAELGVSYDQIDRYLLGEKISPEAEARVEALHRQSEHKRLLPPKLELPKLKGLE